VVPDSPFDQDSDDELVDLLASETDKTVNLLEVDDSSSGIPESIVPTLEILGQKLKGQFEFELGAEPGLFRVGLTNVDLPFGEEGEGGLFPVSVSASGDLTMTSAGIFGAPTASPSINVPGFSISGNIALKINTTDDPQTVGAVELPAGQISAQATGIDLTILGQTLSGDFAFEQYEGQLSPQAANVPGAEAPKIMRIAATNVGLFLGDDGGTPGDMAPDTDDDAGVRLTGGEGFFVLNGTGIAGRLSGGLDISIPGAAIEFQGTFGVAINTTGGEVNEQFEVGPQTINLSLPAGPYLRVEGTDVTLELLGQRILGDFAFEEVTQPSGDKIVRVLAQNVTIGIGDGATNFVSLSQGFGFFVLKSGVTPDNAVFAGEVSGNVVVSVPGVSLEGSFSLAINNSSQVVSETISLGPDADMTTAVALGDVNDDGLIDLVVGNSGEVNVLYLNDGAGDPFDALTPQAIGIETEPTTAVALGDVDKDGDLDLIVGNNGAPNRLYLNDGMGLLELDGADLGTGATTAVALGDIDGDGFEDVVVGITGAINRIFLNQGRDAGTGEWLGFYPGSNIGSESDSTSSLALGDVDNDDDIDLMVGNSGTTTTNRLYLNVGGTLTLDTNLPGDTSDTRSIALGDVNNDGFIDLVAGNYNEPNQYYLNLGENGSWQGFDAALNVAGDVNDTTAVSLNDINGDGDPDVVVGNDGQPTRLYLNGNVDDDTGLWNGFETGEDVGVNGASDVDATGPTTSIALANISNDDDLDLVVGEYGAPNRIFLGDDDGNLDDGADIGVITLDVDIGGPYVRVEGDDISLTVLGQTLTGSFRFVQQSRPDGQRVVEINVHSATLSLGEGLADINVTGSLLITDDGVAGKLGLGASLDLGPVVLSGNLNLLINTLETPVVLNDVHQTRLPAGEFLRIEGIGIQVDIGGVVLTGDFLVEQTTNQVGQRRLTIAATGVSLTVGDIAMTEGEGILLVFPERTLPDGTVQPGGIAGSLSARLDLDGLIDGVSFSGSFGIAINQTSRAILEQIQIDDETLTLDLPTGPFLRVEGQSVELNILGQTLSGNFAFEQAVTPGPDGLTNLDDPSDQVNDDNGSITRIGATEVQLRLGDGTTDFVTLTQGQGSFVILDVSGTNKLAGELSGTVALNIPGVTFYGTLGLKINDTGLLVDETLVVGGEETRLLLEGGNYVRISGTGLSLEVLGQRLSGDFFFEQSRKAGPDGTLGTADDGRIVRLGAKNVEIFLGDDKGTADTADDLGLLVSQMETQEAKFLITDDGLAGELEATVAQRGIVGLTLGGSITLQINNTTQPVNELFEGLSQRLVLPAGPFVRVEVDGTLDVAGQVLGGIFAFEQITSAGADEVINTTDDAEILRIAATNVRLFLGDDGGTPGDTAPDTNDDAGIRISKGNAKFLITPAGFAGEIGAAASIKLGVATATADEVLVQINNTTQAVSEEFLIGGETDTLELPAGPFFSASLTGLSINVAGQTLTGDFTFIQIIDNPDTAEDETEILLRARNVGLRIGTDSRDFVIVRDGEGDLRIQGGATNSGIAGRVMATVEVDIPGVTVGGTFEVEINTTGGAFDLDPGPGSDSIDAGIKVTGTNVSLSILGQTLTGSFTFEKDEVNNVVGVAVKDVTLELGDGDDPFVTVTITQGGLLLTKEGIAAEVTAGITLNPALSEDFSFTGSVTVSINNTSSAVNKTFDIGDAGSVTLNLPAGPFICVQAGQPGSPVQLAVFGQSLQAVFFFEQLTTEGGNKVIRIGFTEVALFLGDDRGNGDPSDDIGVELTGGSGSVLITPQGIAGEFEGTIGLKNVPFTITTTLKIQINNISIPVEERFTFAGINSDGIDNDGDGLIDGADLDGEDAILDLPAGPYFRAAAINTGIVFGPDGSPGLKGDFLFQQATRAGTAEKITIVAVANIQFKSAVSGGDFSNPDLSGGRGAIVIRPEGIAGFIAGRAEIEIPGSQIGATVGLGVNRTGVDVFEEVELNGTTIVIDLLASEDFVLLVQDLDFNFGDLLEIRGDFKLTGDSFSGEGLEIFVGQGPSLNDDGTANPEAIGVLITNASLGVKAVGDKTTGEFGLYATGDVALIGLDGLVVQATATFMVNTSTTAVDVTTSDGTQSLSPGTFSFLATPVDASTPIFSVPGILDISGSFSISRKPNGVLDVSFAAATVAVTIGDSEIFRINGSAGFTIGGVDGFRLQNFRVNGFYIFGALGLGDTGGDGQPVLFPTADLAGPVNGQKLIVSQFNLLGHIDVVFNDLNNVGLNELSITDATQEFELLLNGQPISGVTVNGTPTAVQGRPNTYRYSVSGPLTAGQVTVRFLPQSFSDNAGAGNFGEVEQFSVVQNETDKPGPTAQVSSPANGETVTADSLNAKRYIDVTFISQSDSPIDESTITDGAPEFKITGTGVADLKMRAGLAGVPDLAAPPQHISGTTYRYFFKDQDPNNEIGLFQSGEITVEFLSTATDNFKTEDGTRNVSGLKQTFTLEPSAPGAASTEDPISLGPLTLLGPSIGIEDIGFQDGLLVLTIGIGVDRANLNFGGDEASAQQEDSGVAAELIGVFGTFDLAVDAFGLLSGNFRVELTGKFSFAVAALEVVVPDVVRVEAKGIQVKYDPMGEPDQELVRINSASIQFQKFALRGEINEVIDPNTGESIPGLVVRQNGFTLGEAILCYGCEDSTLELENGETKISFGSILELDDIRIGVSRFTVNFDGGNPFADFSGSIFIASGGAKLFPGRPISATIADRMASDDVKPNGEDDTEAIRLQLTFSRGKVDSFQFEIDTLEINLSTFVTLKAVDVVLDTGAADNEELISFQSIGAKVKIGSVEIGGEARNFAFLGDGSFRTKPGFGIFLSIGSATGDSFKWPEFLPIKINAIGIEWLDIQNHPDDFTLVLSASVTGIKGIKGLTFSGAIEGVRISPKLLLQGKFPIIEIASIGVQVKGNIFGGEIDAALIGGILKVDKNFNIIGPFDSTTPVEDRVFFVGVQGGFSVAGVGGLTIRFGLSELGPLGVYINVEIPGGIVLVPPMGLALKGFSAGVEFFKSLPSIDDPFALRGSEFGLPTELTPEQWLASLKLQIVLQLQRLRDNPNLNGFTAAFTAPMTITGSAKLFSIYTSEKVFNAEVMVKISTDGKFLISGVLNFADNNISLSGKLYADLSNVTSGDVTVLFLADVPDQVRLLTVHGKLKMGFKNASGEEVTFDVVESLPPTPTEVAPTAMLIDPVEDEGSVDVNTVNSEDRKFTGDNVEGDSFTDTRYIDVVYNAPSGATLDYHSILDSDPEFTVTTIGSPNVNGSPVPMETLMTDEGTVVVPLEVQADGSITRFGPSREVLLTEDDVTDTGDVGFDDDLLAALTPAQLSRLGLRLENQNVKNPDDTIRVVRVVTAFVQETVISAGEGVDDTDRLILAIQKSGTNRFRYLFNNSSFDFEIGTFEVSFLAGGFKNADVVLEDGNVVPGAENVASEVSQIFTVEGATAILTDPGAGGSIDVNLLNNRNYIDVSFVAPTSPAGLTIDEASIIDFEPEFTLTGPGVGTVSVDNAKLPVRLSDDGTTKVFRYWLIGEFGETGDVILTYLADSWAFNISGATGGTSQVTLSLGEAQQFLTVVFPAADLGDPSDPSDDKQIVEASVTDEEPEIQIVLTAAPGTGDAAGWSVSLTTAVAANTETLPVRVADNVYRYPLDIDTSAATAATVVVQYEFIDQTWFESPDGTATGQTVVALEETNLTDAFNFDFNNPAINPNVLQTLALGDTLPGTIQVAIPVDLPAGFEDFILDPASITDIDGEDTNEFEFTVNGNWDVLLDTSRAPVQLGDTNVFEFPVSIVLPSEADASITITVDFTNTQSQWAYTGVPEDGTRPGDTHNRGNLSDTNSRSYIDVAFRPSSGNTLDAVSIVEEGAQEPEFALSGFGAAAVTVLAVEPHFVGNNTYRYLLEGDFMPGEVSVDFAENSWQDSGDSGVVSNRGFSQIFSVEGTTADLVKRIMVPVVDGDGEPTGAEEETVVALNGRGIGRDTINGHGYLEVTFQASGGFELEHTSINGDELELRDGEGNLIPFDPVPLRVGLSNTYRYEFSGTIEPGDYTVTFVAGSFVDKGGVVNQPETETFRVEVPSVKLADPMHGEVVDREELNGRSYIDVTFNPVRTDNEGTITEMPVDPDSILDEAPEIEIAGGADDAIVVDGAPVRLGESDTYRYFFTGKFSSDNVASVSFIAGSWTDTAKNPVTQENIDDGGNPAAIHESPSGGELLGRTYIDVTFTPTNGSQVDASTVDGDEISLTGADGENMRQPTSGPKVVQLDSTTFRYLFQGQFDTGLLTVDFAAGTWQDTSGNFGVAASEQIGIITQAESFFIELSGGIILEAAELFDEPLMEVKASATLEMDFQRQVFQLSFAGQLNVIKLGTVGATAGRFILDTSNTLSDSPQFWGVATMETNFEELEQFGVFLFGKGTLQVNTTEFQKTETLSLPGLGPNGSDLKRTFHLAPVSFSIELVAQLRIRPPGTDTDLVRMEGGFYLNISPAKFEIFAMAELSFGVGDAQITYGKTTGLIVVATGLEPGRNFGVAGFLTVSASAGIGLPDVGDLFRASGSVTVMFNTTLQDQVFVIPDAFLPLINEGDPTTIEIFASAPGLDGMRNPNAPPGGEVYLVASIQAELSIGGVLSLTGFIRIEAAVSAQGFRLEITGAISTEIAYLGSLTGTLNLNVFVGPRPGIVGRVFLSLAVNDIPAVNLNGVFLLEINTFPNENAPERTIETFKIEKETIFPGTANEREVFTGFARDAGGNLIVERQQIGVVGGFRLLMSGQLIVAEILVIEAEVQFRLELGGDNPGIELIVNGLVQINPIGELKLVDSGFRINGEGLVARFDLQLDLEFGREVGLKFQASALLNLNTTGRVQTLGSTSVDPGFRLRLDGNVEFLGFAKASGFVDVIISPEGFQLEFAVLFELGGLDLRANGGAAVVVGSDPGLVLRLHVSIDVDVAVFLIQAGGTFELNTTNTERLGVAPNSFLLALNGKIEILKVLKFDSSLRIEVKDNEWSFRLNADVDFFGIVSLSGSVFLDSDANFDINLRGRMVLGSSSFGLSGSFHFRVRSEATTDNIGNPYYIFELSGGATVRARLFGITLAGLGLNFSFKAEGAGRTKVELKVTVKVKILLATVKKTARFTIGYLELPKPVYLAGQSGSTISSARNWDPETPSELHLNVGSRAQFRNIAEGEANESYLIEQIAGDDTAATIKVKAMGRSNKFENVTKIVGNFGSGDDRIRIADSVRIPVDLDMQGGDDIIDYAGRHDDVIMPSVLAGGSGSDYILARGPGAILIQGGDEDNTGVTDPADRKGDFLIHTGGGVATIDGGDGDDRIFGGSSGDILVGNGGNDDLTGPALLLYADFAPASIDLFWGTVTATDGHTITDDNADFPTAGPGLAGLQLDVTSVGTATIVSNTRTSLTLDSPLSALADNAYSVRAAVGVSNSGSAGDDYVTLDLVGGSLVVEGGANLPDDGDDLTEERGDTLELIGTPDSDTVEVRKPLVGPDQLEIVITNSDNQLTRPINGFEHLEIDGRGGADDFTARDIATANLETFTIELGRRFTVNGTKIIVEEIDGNKFNREVPNTFEFDDGLADTVLVEGSASDDVFLLSAEGEDSETRRFTRVNVAREGAEHPGRR
jgi:hypothetical protein